MIGSDPVWPVEQLNPWEQPDAGWENQYRFLDFHRGWLADLPRGAERTVRLDNAGRFFHKGI